MSRHSPQRRYDREDAEHEARRRDSRAQVRGDSRARDFGDGHQGGARHHDRPEWHRRNDSRTRDDYERSRQWKEENMPRRHRGTDSRSRRSRSLQHRSRNGHHRGDSRDERRKGDQDRQRSRIAERSRSRSFEAGGFGYGHGRGQGADQPVLREAEVRQIPKVQKAKPGPKKAPRRRGLAERGKPQTEDGKPKGAKTIHDPYQLFDPSDKVGHKVILADGERKEPEEEPQERLGRGPHAGDPSGRGRPGNRDRVGRSRSCSYSYYESYSCSSGWSTPRRQNSRSRSAGRRSHPIELKAAPGAPPGAPPGPPPGSWLQPQAEPPSGASCTVLAVPPASGPPSGPPGAPPHHPSLHPGLPQPSHRAWDYRGHSTGHYPPQVRPPPHFYGLYPPHVHYQSAGFAAPPPGYGFMPPFGLGYGQLQAGPRIHHRQGGRKGMRNSDSRDGSNTPTRKKKRRKNRRPKSPGVPPPKWGETWEEPRSSNGLKLIHEIAPKDLKWKVVLSDEPRRSYASYMPSPVPKARLASFFKTIHAETEWEQPEGPHGLMPRKTAWMVQRGCKCRYRYGGVTIPPQEFPEWMTELLRTYMPYCGKTEDEWPDSCNVNLYEDGSHSVGWHTDDEALFQSLHQDTAIVSLSLGQPRKFDLRKNWPEEGERVQERLHLGDGALATMEGMLQKHYMHRIARDNESLGPRINLTWRWIKKHAQACPKSRC